MLRLTHTFNKLGVRSDTCSLNNVNLQIIRWRKPRWIPIAKSKMFKVPPRTITPEDETLELRRLNNNYNTQMKSLRRYLITKYSNQLLSTVDPEEHKRIFKEDFARCSEINNKWNEEQKILREKRVAKVFEAELDFARTRLETELLKQQQMAEEAEQIVLREIEESKNYITPENIDAAIESAMANPIDYNFSINTNGEKIFGRENSGDVKQEVKQ